MSDAIEPQPQPAENTGLAAGARSYGTRATRAYPARRIARSGATESRRRPWIRSRFVRVVLWGLFASVLSVGTLVVFHAPILRAAAHAWVVSDEAAPADAIIILAGNAQSRPHKAAELFHAQMAPKVLLTDIPAIQGLEQPGLDYVSGTLMSNGVPEEAIVIRRTGVRSTFDEAETVLAWSATERLDRILIVTDAFHTRRTRWIFDRILEGHGIDYRIVAADPVDYSLDYWWTDENGLIEFNNEVIKYIFYLFKY